MSWSTQGDNLNNFGSTCIDNATYKVSRSSVYWFSRRRFIKVFTIYGHGGHVGHVHTCQVLGKSKSEIARAPLIFAYNLVIKRAEKSGAKS